MLRHRLLRGTVSALEVAEFADALVIADVMFVLSEATSQFRIASIHKLPPARHAVDVCGMIA